MSGCTVNAHSNLLVLWYLYRCGSTKYSISRFLILFLFLLQLEYEADPNSLGTGILRVSGYVRSRAISVNQLVCNSYRVK